MIPLLLMLAAVSFPPLTPPVRVERSRDTPPTAGTSVSTSLDTNGKVEGQTPIDAERAFAADAKTIGQWTAFRKWSTDDAMMFVPQPVNAHEFLKDRKDPPRVIDWWPTASYISCDGSVAVNTGGWKRPDGSVGYFTTVWTKLADGGWKWVLDHGDQLAKARPLPPKPKVQKAACGGVPYAIGNEAPDPGQQEGGGASKDGTLKWHWTVLSGGSRAVSVHLWNGRKNVMMLVDSVVPAPTK